MNWLALCIMLIPLSFFFGLTIGSNYFHFKGLSEGIGRFFAIYLKIMKDRFNCGEEDAIRILNETTKELNQK